MTTELLDLAVDLQRAMLHMQRRPSDQGDDRAERGLSAAGFACQPENLALLDLYRHIVDSDHILAGGVINSTDVLER